MGSKIYTGLMFLSLFEPPLLSFLPWFASDFAKASYFPTLATLRLTFLFKLFQLSVTFVAQILVIYYQYSNSSGIHNDGFMALVYLNVCLSFLTFVLKIVEGAVKRGVLAGSALSEESEGAYAEATAAIRLDLENGNENNDDGGGRGRTATEDTSHGLELANIYPALAQTTEANPMHRRVSVANAEGARESDSLLRLQSRVEYMEKRMNSKDEEMRAFVYAQMKAVKAQTDDDEGELQDNKSEEDARDSLS